MKGNAKKLAGQLLVILLVGGVGYLLFHPELWVAAGRRILSPETKMGATGQVFFKIEPNHRTPPRYAKTVSTGERRPLVLAFHAGKLYAAYEGLNMVEIFNSAGSRDGYFDAYPQGELAIGGLEFNEAGGLYLVDGRSRQVLVYDAQRVFKGFFPPVQPQQQPLGLPVNIAARRGQVFIVDLGGSAVRIFLENGEEVLTINQGGAGAMGPWHPVSTAQTMDGRLLVSDLLNKKIAVFNCAGKFAYSFADPEGGEMLTAPGALAIDDLGRVHVIDSGTNRILVYDPYGRFLFGYGLQASGGKLSPMGGIAVDPEKKLLFVADVANRQIEVWDYRTDQ